MTDQKPLTQKEPNCPICNDQPPHFRCYHYQGDWRRLDAKDATEG